MKNEVDGMKQELAELLFPTVMDRKILEQRYPKRNLNPDAMVTRFAPSPTGFLHLGSLYTAFVSYLYAKQSKGIFYLRIEDTDQKREVIGGIERIQEDLKAFEIFPSEGIEAQGSYGPYQQSYRKEIYHSMAKYLVEKGLAYPCFCSEEQVSKMRKEQEQKKERLGYYGTFATCRNLSLEVVKQKLAKQEPYVLRLRSQGSFDRKITFEDCIKGTITFPENDMDIVLLKQDGLPTYHFAHVIDDYFMRTTHVIRGDEWLSSVPIHLELASALDILPCSYAHLAPLTIRDGESIRKLSKRKDPECAIAYYSAEGIPEDVLKLYFASIINADFEAWYEPGKDLFDFPFQFSKMSVGGTLFDLSKLRSLAKEYLGEMDAKTFYQNLLEYAKQYDSSWYQILKEDPNYALAVFNIERGGEKPRKDITCYQEAKEAYGYMFDDYFHASAYTTEKLYSIPLLEAYQSIYSPTDTEEVWLQKIKLLGENYGYASNRKDFKLHPEIYNGQFCDVCEMLRVAVTGRLQTPNLYYILKVLGPDRMQERIHKFIQYLQKRLAN